MFTDLTVPACEWCSLKSYFGSLCPWQWDQGPSTSRYNCNVTEKGKSEPIPFEWKHLYIYTWIASTHEHERKAVIIRIPHCKIVSGGKFTLCSKQVALNTTLCSSKHAYNILHPVTTSKTCSLSLFSCEINSRQSASSIFIDEKQLEAAEQIRQIHLRSRADFPSKQECLPAQTKLPDIQVKNEKKRERRRVNLA